MVFADERRYARGSPHRGVGATAFGATCIAAVLDDWSRSTYAVSWHQTVTQVIGHFSNTGYIDLPVPDDAPVVCNLQTVRVVATVGDKEYFLLIALLDLAMGWKELESPPPCNGNYEFRSKLNISFSHRFRRYF